MDYRGDKEDKTHFFSSQENVHIGTQGENYARSLFGLMRYPNGDRAPDLVSVNGSYSPKLSMEVKSSRSGRGVVNSYGLTYGFKSPIEFASVFGSHDNEIPSSIGVSHEPPKIDLLDSEPSAFYYNLMFRTDNLNGKDFSHPYSDLGITFGDQIIVPSNLILYSFIIGKMENGKLTFNQAFQSVRDIIQMFMSEGYKYNEADKRDIQAINFVDFLALFAKDDSLLTTPAARQRVKLLEEHYGHDAIARLGRTHYVGPNRSNIFVLYNKSDENLFTHQLPARIAQRRKDLELIIAQRKRNFETLRNGYVLNSEINLFTSQDLPRVSISEEQKLNRLLEWRLMKDNGVEFSDKHPNEVEKLPF